VKSNKSIVVIDIRIKIFDLNGLVFNKFMILSPINIIKFFGYILKIAAFIIAGLKLIAVLTASCVRDCSGNPFLRFFNRKKDWSERRDPCGNANRKDRQTQNIFKQIAVVH